MERKFKILSIDGGGIRGIIPARVLADLEQFEKQNGKDRPLYEHFDLICGTSTGAIIAIGIALGISAQKILNFYKQYASSIFPNRVLNIQMLKGIYNPIYENKVLLEKLEEIYRKSDGSTALLNDAKTSLCIPSFNGGSGEINILKTKHNSNYNREYKFPAHHVAMASASAPIYLPPHSFTYNNQFGDGANINMIDGGVFANNPSMIGLLEATDKFERDFNDIMILSIGTGRGRHVLKKRWKMPGFRYWLFPEPRIFDIMLDSQAQITEQYISFLSRSLKSIGKDLNYYRVQHEFEGKPIALNASRKRDIDHLDSIGQELAKKNISNIANIFFN